ncbi:MAG: 50S ribosomal protein L9 [Dehalococcoidia bacterium]|nr:MAG: 50S ribosomal protein L9 [Dehalococcoidia bacterium]
MKVVFIEDVSTKEKKGDIKEVSDGYARNYLLPRGLALPASAGAVKAAEKISQERERKSVRLHDEYIELARQIEGKELRFKGKASSKGTLHGSITSADIADKLSNLVNVDIDKKKIVMKNSLHNIGEYEVEVIFSRDAAAKIMVIIERETA